MFSDLLRALLGLAAWFLLEVMLGFAMGVAVVCDAAFKCLKPLRDMMTPAWTVDVVVSELPEQFGACWLDVNERFPWTGMTFSDRWRVIRLRFVSEESATEFWALPLVEMERRLHARVVRVGSVQLTDKRAARAALEWMHHAYPETQAPALSPSESNPDLRSADEEDDAGDIV